MLAYVFWHWRRPDMAAADYESRQRAFHAALAAAPSPGFLRSLSHAVTGAPWAADGGEAYEDWYLTRDSAALDPLNAAAISASRAAPHDAAAAGAAGGTAGLYTLRQGAPPERPAHEYWFARPAGMGYAALLAALSPVTRDDRALWCRFMTLGPSPEFCLQSRTPVVLPSPFDGALALTVRNVGAA